VCREIEQYFGVPSLLSQYSDGLRGGRSRFDSQQGQESFLYSTVSRLALEPTLPPTQWVPGALSPGGNQPGREATHSPPASADVKNGRAIPPVPLTSSWRDA
jgi:hypothetical protein